MKKTLTLCCLLIGFYGFAQESRQLKDSIPNEDGQILIESENASKPKKAVDESLEKAEGNDPAGFAIPSSPAPVLQAEALGRYRAAPYPSAAGSDLLKAYELSENKVDLLDEMMAYYEIMGDEASIQRTADKIRTTAKYHPTIMRYQDHLLQAIPDGSILVTNGEWDSYPLICRILANDREVIMINLQLLTDPVYRLERLPANGLSVPEEVKGAEFIQRLAQQNPEREVYVGMTVPKDILRSLRSELYQNGLSFRYGESTSVESLQSQWKTSLSDDLSAETVLPVKVARLRLNYLPLLGTILRKAEEEQRIEEAENMRGVIDRICTQAGRPELKERFK